MAVVRRGGDISTRDRNQLIEQYRDFVHYVVGKMARTLGLPLDLLDEFISAGYLGLVEAAQRFDFDAGAEFSSFAYLRIRGAVIDNIRKNSEVQGRAYRTARALQATQEVREDFAEQHGFSDASDPEGALAEVLDFVASGSIAFRLSVGDVDAETGSTPDPVTPESDLLAAQDSKLFRELVATLPEKERLIIEEYYFNDKSFTEIADEHAGLSKSWISRLHTRALERIRELYLARTAEHE